MTSSERLKFLLILQFLILFFISTGTFLLNSTDNSLILLITLFSIPLYALLVVKFSDGLSKEFYFVSLVIIGLSIALIIPLRGLILARDGPLEYHIFHLTLLEGRWDPGYEAPAGTCLYSLLLPVLQQVSGVNGLQLYIFGSALTAPFIGCISFLLYYRYVGPLNAFLLSLFLLSQNHLIYAGLGNIRVYLSLVFFALVLMIWFNDMAQQNKKTASKSALAIIFILSAIANYYGTAYFLVFFFLLTWLLLKFISRFIEEKESSIFESTIIMLTAVFTFFWYSQDKSYLHLTSHLERMFKSLNEMFTPEIRGELEQKGVGVGLSNPDIFNVVVMYITLFLMFFGCSIILKKINVSKYFKEMANRNLYASTLILSLILVVTTAVTPVVAVKTIGYLRIYQYIIFIALPGLLVGVEWFSDVIRSFKKGGNRVSDRHTSQKHIAYILVLIIALQLIVNTGVTYHLYGEEPLPIILNNKGRQYNIWYLHESELTGAEFIVNKMNKELTIHGDRYIYHRIIPYWNERYTGLDTLFFLSNKSIKNGYLFLRYQNVVNGEVLPFGAAYSKITSIRKYHGLIEPMNKIYDNGGSIVYKVR